MAYWLLKSEPQDYSWADLAQDGRTVWNGVKNPLALKYLRTMQPADEALIYHTGIERRVVGVAEIITLPYPDPAVDDPLRVVVEITAVRSLPQPVTLAQIKQGNFTGFDLIACPGFLSFLFPLSIGSEFFNSPVSKLFILRLTRSRTKQRKAGFC
jgi:hypothetical protein